MDPAKYVPLAPLTTLRLGGVAKLLVTAEHEADLLDAVREVDAAARPLLVLGGGSNVVIGDAGFDGTVLRIATAGLATKSDGDEVLVTAKAGEPWDAFVTTMVSEGLAGVECLAGIPGLVGAVPMQNVGAYGQDVSETIVRVRAWDRDADRIVELDREMCRFAYRTSAFRGRDRHVILDVTFRLERSGESCPIRYAELARALALTEGASAPLETVRATIVSLRRKKAMVLDPADPDTASAGSFFTNPILSAPDLARLRERIAASGPEIEGGAASLSLTEIPIFPEYDGRFKVSAAWLIERAGFSKGYCLGRVGVSTKHALALTNRGGATTTELLALARRIRAQVHARFGVLLENEPVLVGVTLDEPSDALAGEGVH